CNFEAGITEESLPKGYRGETWPGRIKLQISLKKSTAWFELLTEIIEPSVSPGGVGMYCPASRAAVYKRIKEGKLSISLPRHLSKDNFIRKEQDSSRQPVRLHTGK